MSKTFYLGWTNDINRRLDEHNKGKSGYTKSRRPWELIAYNVFETREEAKKRERQLKKNPRLYSLFKKRMLAQHAQGMLRWASGEDPTTCLLAEGKPRRGVRSCLLRQVVG